MQQEVPPFAQAFSLMGRETWVLTDEEMHAVRVMAGREQQEEEGDGGDDVWQQAAQAHQGGWGDWPQQPQPQYQNPHHGYEYIPRTEFEVLANRVGGVENTLHEVNANINTLTYNFSHFTTNYGYQQPPPPPQDDE